MILLFSGCSYKSEYSYGSDKQTSEQSVANTKKTQLPIGKKPKVFVTVTYLNSIKNKNFIDKNLEQFVVGIHNVDLNAKEKKISSKNIKFFIENSQMGVSVKKLKADNQILRIIPASNPWSSYYLVQTPIINKDFIKFSFEIHPFSKASLTFEKDY